MKKVALLLSLLLVFGAMAFAQDLKIDYQLKVGAPDPANYLTFTGPIRYMAVEKDTLDATSGASKFGSTHVFQTYLYDVKGKYVLPSGLRGLFLYAVGSIDEQKDDNLTVFKAADGTITMQFAHRGTAYGLITDKNGKFTFPKGNFFKRAIGYIKSGSPQVISKDFSTDGTASTINWSKVWNASTPDGKIITEGVANKTGKIADDNGVAEAMYRWEGSLQVTFENNILKIVGGMNAVKN